MKQPTSLPVSPASLISTVKALRDMTPLQDQWVLDAPIDNRTYFEQYRYRQDRLNSSKNYNGKSFAAHFRMEKLVDLHFALHALENQHDIEQHHAKAVTISEETSVFILARAMELAGFVDRWYPNHAPLFSNDFLYAHKTNDYSARHTFTAPRFAGPLRDAAVFELLCEQYENVQTGTEEYSHDCLREVAPWANLYAPMVALWIALAWENKKLVLDDGSDILDVYLSSFILPPQTPRELVEIACPEALEMWSTAIALQLDFVAVVNALDNMPTPATPVSLPEDVVSP